jgi:ABC-2 type transport system permease protein
LLLPAVVALGMQLIQMLPVPVAVRLALPGYAFISWNGLFTSPAQLGPLLISIVISLLWAVAATSAAWFLFLRRDFTNPAHDGLGSSAITAGLLPLVVLLALSATLLGLVTGATGSGIDRGKVQRSVATAFASLYRLQAGQLNRSDVTEEQLKASAACTKGDDQVAGHRADGPGNDWRCVVTWHLPGVEATGSAVYQIDVNPLGRFTADGDGPQEVNGYFLVRTPSGDEPNPLWQFDGIVDLLPTVRKE